MLCFKQAACSSKIEVIKFSDTQRATLPLEKRFVYSNPVKIKIAFKLSWMNLYLFLYLIFLQLCVLIPLSRLDSF